MPNAVPAPLSVLVQGTMPPHVRDILHDRLGVVFTDEDHPRPLGGYLSPDVRVVASERTQGQWAITAHWIEQSPDLPSTKPAWVLKHLEAARDLVTDLPV